MFKTALVVLAALLSTMLMMPPPDLAAPVRFNVPCRWSVLPVKLFGPLNVREPVPVFNNPPAAEIWPDKICGALLL